MPSNLNHNLPVLIHIDEFQALVNDWFKEKGNPTRKQVTIQGLQSMLEGMETPLNVMFIFTSSEKLPELNKIDKQFREEWYSIQSIRNFNFG